MLLETLYALDRAGAKALRTTCGLDVVEREISLVREGRRNFRSLGTLRLKGCPLQMVHLGCDEQLSGKLAESQGPCCPGLDGLAENFLGHLLEKFDDRNPRGVLETRREAPAAMHTRGIRTFQFRQDTGQGQLLYLAEVPSRTEMAIARGSDFLTSMESIYLPDNWRGSDELPGPEAVDSFLAFLRKTEGDVYLETPADEETATMNLGLLVETCEVGGLPALKFITDFSAPQTGVPEPGAIARASVGVGDRSLEFDLEYLAPAAHELASGTLIPCALFSLPRTVAVGQRRRSFRVSVSVPIEVELEAALGKGGVSPWSETDIESEAVTGLLADLSFSGARINAEGICQRPGFQRGDRVTCRMHFPGTEEPLLLQGIIRRASGGPADRNNWQDDIGIEFIIARDGDRKGLDYVRQYVLEVQRARLSQRLQLTGS